STLGFLAIWRAFAELRPVAIHTRSPSKAGCTTRTLGWFPSAVARYAQVALAAAAWALSQNVESLIQKNLRNLFLTRPGTGLTPSASPISLKVPHGAAQWNATPDARRCCATPSASLPAR